MTKETIDNLNDNIEYLRKLEKESPDHSKKLLGNISRGAECVKSVYVMIDTVKNVIDFIKSILCQKGVKLMTKINNRLKKKQQALKHNTNYVPISLDPLKYTWKSKHKPCKGTGMIGIIKETNKPLMCICVKSIVYKNKE